MSNENILFRIRHTRQILAICEPADTIQSHPLIARDLQKGIVKLA